MQSKDRSSTLVRDLCEKLKIQLDQLGIAVEESPPSNEEDSKQRKNLFKALQDQLAELSR